MSRIPVFSLTFAILGFLVFAATGSSGHPGALITDAEASTVSGGSYCGFTFTTTTVHCSAKQVPCGSTCVCCASPNNSSFKQLSRCACCLACSICTPCNVCSAGSQTCSSYVRLGTPVSDSDCD
jgi:hypothetical protein